jgi:integrase
MATISRLPSGQWRAQIRVRGHAPVSITRRTKAAVEREAARIEEEIRSGRYRDAGQARALLLANLLDWYFDTITPQKSATALSREASRIRMLQEHPALRHCTLETLSPAAVAAFIDDRKRSGMLPATIARDLSVLGNAIEAGISLLRVVLPHGNPVSEVRRSLRHTKTLQVRDARDRRLGADEETALLAELNPLMRAAVILLLETAMRREELCKARREHRTGHTLAIYDAKTGSRIIPLSPKAIAVIEALPARTDGLLLGLRPDSVTQAFARACQRAGIVDLRVHDLRHEAISRLFESGWSVAEVAAVSGHADWRCLSRYTQISPTHLAHKMRTRQPL